MSDDTEKSKGSSGKTENPVNEKEPTVAELVIMVKALQTEVRELRESVESLKRRVDVCEVGEMTF
jgi:predicted RNase H-like nuclease (RuvC/YqgF family)